MAFIMASAVSLPAFRVRADAGESGHVTRWFTLSVGTAGCPSDEDVWSLW